MILPVESAKASYVFQGVWTESKAINKGVAVGSGREGAGCGCDSGRDPGCHREGLKTDFLFPGRGEGTTLDSQREKWGYEEGCRS